jgi:hypothetical protein
LQKTANRAFKFHSVMSLFEKYPGSIFLREAAVPHLVDVKERLERLFEAIDGFEDPHFGTEFDNDPLARIWEMMVATILRDSGVKYGSSKGCGPDFIASHFGLTVAVEATCPSLGREGLPDSVPPLVPTEDFQLCPEDKMLLRVANAISEKTRIFEEYRRKGLIGPSDCCVIAISSLKLNRARGRVPCLGISASLGHGLPYAAFDAKSGVRVMEGFQFQEAVQKVSGSDVRMTPFLDRGNSIISGLLYSDASPYALDFRLREETFFIHNPMAQHPVPVGTFQVGGDYQTIMEEVTGSPITIDVRNEGPALIRC